MKKSENGDFLREKIQSENIALPENLSKESITGLVSGKKQKSNVKKYVKSFVSAAVAACIVICSVTLFKSTVFAPDIEIPEDGIAYAESYNQISGLMKDYFKSQEQGFEINLFSKKSTDLFDTAEDIAAEEIMTDSAYESYAAPASDGTVNADESYSETNLRELGVEEADTLKTDGRYIYACNNERILIIAAEGTGLTLCSKITQYESVYDETGIGTYWCYIDGFYLCDDRLIVDVTESVYDAESEESYSVGAKTTTGVHIYDISDRNNPVCVRKIMFDGDTVSSRIVDGKLIYISQKTFYEENFVADDYTSFIPAVYADDKVYYPEADSIAIVNPDSVNQFLSVTIVDINDSAAVPETLTLSGCGSDIYCTTASLYVFASEYAETPSGAVYEFVNGLFYPADSNADAGICSTVMSFDISGTAPVFRAKGSIEGSILNTWSVDEYNGYLRIAATDDGTYIYVLDGNLDVVGKSEMMAEGEWVESVRFSGDTAYTVTYYTTDPLFVIDLSDVTSPKVTGELKLPGFSSYLHPVGEELILGVGTGGTDEGTDGSAKLSLFDVSDPFNPVEIDKYTVETAYFNTDYKAFVSGGDGTYLIPLTDYDSGYENDGNDLIYKYTETGGALRISTENGKITVLNEYTEISDTFFGNPRVMYINGNVYIVQSGEQLHISVWNMETGEKINTFDF